MRHVIPALRGGDQQKMAPTESAPRALCGCSAVGARPATRERRRKSDGRRIKESESESIESDSKKVKESACGCENEERGREGTYLNECG